MNVEILGPNGRPVVVVPVAVNEFPSGASVSRKVPVPSGIRKVAFAVLPEIVPLMVSASSTSVPESWFPLCANEKTLEPRAVHRPDHGPPAQRAGVGRGVSRGSVPPLW